MVDDRLYRLTLAPRSLLPMVDLFDHMSVHLLGDWSEVVGLEMDTVLGELPFDSSATDQQMSRTQIDLSEYDEARLTVNMMKKDATEGVVSLQYSLDGGSTFQSLDGAGGPSADLDVGPVTGIKTDGFVSLESAAQADVVLRLVGIDPEAKKPEVGIINVQFRRKVEIIDPAIRKRAISAS